MDCISQQKRYLFGNIAQNQTNVNQTNHDGFLSLRTYPLKVLDLYNYISKRYNAVLIAL